MGAYTENLRRRATINRLEKRTHYQKGFGPGDGDSRVVEHLTDAAILRNGQLHFGGKSHAQVRAKLGDSPCYESRPGDVEGFMTSTRRFVDRSAARMIAIEAGQVPPSFARTLLSSDIKW